MSHSSQPARETSLLPVILAGAIVLLVVHALGRFIFPPLLPYLVADGHFPAGSGAALGPREKRKKGTQSLVGEATLWIAKGKSKLFLTPCYGHVFLVTLSLHHSGLKPCLRQKD